MKKKTIIILIICLIILIGILVFIFKPEFFRFKNNSNSNMESEISNPISSKIENKAISDIVLNKENFEEIMTKYGDTYSKNSNEYLYLSYAEIYYVTQDGFKNALNTDMTDEQKDDAMYERIYGKTINQLISEGKQLMKENNITPEQWKENMNSMSTNTTEN